MNATARHSVGDVIAIRGTEYIVRAVKPYPNARKPIAWNLGISRNPLTAADVLAFRRRPRLTWIADYAIFYPDWMDISGGSLPSNSNRQALTGRRTIK